MPESICRIAPISNGNLDAAWRYHNGTNPGELESAAVPDLHALALLLHFSAGVTKEKRFPGGETFFFRAAACTGALYEFELYLVCGDLPGLDAGVYHFGVKDSSLRGLRQGDWRGVLAGATGGEPAIVRAPLVIVCAGTYWRNAWKYQAGRIPRSGTGVAG